MLRMRSTSPPKSAWPGVSTMLMRHVPAPDDRGAFGEDRDAALALEVVRIEGALGHLLVGAEGAALAQQLVDQRGLAVVDMGDDRDVAEFHDIQRQSRGPKDAGGGFPVPEPAGNLRLGSASAISRVESAASGRAPTWLMISAAHRLPIAPQMGSGRPRVKP